MVQDK